MTRRAIKKFKITDYSEVYEYEKLSEEVADKRFSGLKRLHQELLDLISQYEVVNDKSGRWVLRSQANGLNGGLWHVSTKVDPAGLPEINAAYNAIVDYCNSILPELQKIKRAHPDGHRFNCPVRMAYSFLTAGGGVIEIDELETKPITP